MKRIFIIISSILGGLASAWFGGWDMILQTFDRARAQGVSY